MPQIDWSKVPNEKKKKHKTMPSYTRDSGCPTHNFSVVICRRRSDNKYLAVKETKNRGWWCPAGWVDPGETFVEAAIRETKEEGGIDIEVKGILRVEHSHNKHGARMRVIFYAEPRDEEQAPKTEADKESEEARYVSVDEFKNSLGKIRGGELIAWGSYLDDGGPIFPLSILVTKETAPVVMPVMPEGTPGSSK